VRELTVLETSPAACCVPLDDEAMSVEDAQATATVFKALADPTRVRIVNLLVNAGQPLCVCELTPHLDLSQPTVSFHLKKLAQAGLLDREQSGIWANYTVNREAIERVADVLRLKEAIT
jgi:ArsR family transcriptional regulator